MFFCLLFNEVIGDIYCKRTLEIQAKMGANWPHSTEQPLFWRVSAQHYLGKIIAAIFDFYSSRRLGKERNLY